MSDKTKTTLHSTVKNVLPSFDPREPDKAELYVHDLLTPAPGKGATRQKADTHRPDIIRMSSKCRKSKGPASINSFRRRSSSLRENQNR